jgi:DNA-binding Xre family transcriptional regulator
MPTRWKLKELLVENDITPYRLGAESAVSANTIYKLTRKAPARVDMATLSLIIPALRRLTGKPINVQDLMEYTDDAINQ